MNEAQAKTLAGSIGMAEGVAEALALMRSAGAGRPQKSERLTLHPIRPPRLSIWQGQDDRTVAPGNADQIARQWQAVAGLPALPDSRHTVGTRQTQVWTDPSGRTVLEIHRLAGLGHATPIATGGPAGLGRAAPHIVECGHSSTRLLAESWGLASPSQARRQDPLKTDDLAVANDDPGRAAHRAGVTPPKGLRADTYLVDGTSTLVEILEATAKTSAAIPDWKAAVTREAILKALADLAATAVKEDTVCIYFSGHGAAPNAPHSEESRLVPVDGRLDDLASTTISATEFSTALHAIKADRLLVFLDACHAEGAGVVKGSPDQADIASGFTEKSIDRLAEGVGRAILASSRTDEVSLIMPGARNSAFTAALLEGLQGAADPNQEGVITLFNLFTHIEKQVPHLTSDRQHPILRTRLQNNLVVALANGGAKAAGSTEPSADSVDDWTSMNSIFSALYPSGPTDREIWDRAGGDVAMLDLRGNGRSGWFTALRMLRQGGGGERITKLSLLAVASSDFPNNSDLRRLRQ